MTMNISLDLYSGRPNPDWQLPAVVSMQVFSLLNDLGLFKGNLHQPFPGRLGYRGLRVNVGPALSIKYRVPLTLSLSVTGSFNHSKLMKELSALAWAADFLGIKGFFDAIQSVIKSLTGRGSGAASGGAPKAAKPTMGPCEFEMLPFDPSPWNQPAFQPTNNCYAYAANLRKSYSSKPQPGIGSGSRFSAITGADVGAAAKRDGAHEVTDCFPDSEKPRCLVALVIWPGEDYHWYRKHPDCWGHKPGGTVARNTDESGAVITNPQTCDRGDYTEFTGYMLLPKGLKVAAS